MFLVLLMGWRGEVRAETITLSEDRVSGFGQVIDRGITPQTYNYAPSIMLDEGVYRMWWCGNFEPVSKPEDDKILYSTSMDGVSWTPAVKVLDSQKRPNQGRCACDPTVVKLNADYYMFYTTDNPEKMDGMSWSQTYLAWSAGSGSPAKFSYAFEGKPVIAMPAEFDRRQLFYGRGQSSVIWKDGRLIQFFSDMTEIDPETGDQRRVSVAESLDGGKTFRTIKTGIIKGVSSMDFKYVPEKKMYLAVGEKPQWQLRLFVFDEKFELVKELVLPSVINNGKRSNHNPGLLGDRYGNLVDEEMVTIYFASSGEVTELPSPSGPYNWKIYRMKIDLGKILSKTTPTPITGKCKRCPSDFECYSNGNEKRWFADGYVMEGFVAGGNCSGVAKPNYVGKENGDANCDGVVDGNDYSIWRKEYVDVSRGEVVVRNNWEADFTGVGGKCDGVVDGNDYSLWRARYQN